MIIEGTPSLSLLSPNLKSLIERIEEIISVDTTPNFLTNDQVASQLTCLLKSHPLRESDWQPYALFDGGRYTRNLIALGEDERFGLMVLAWGPGQASPIHDHAESHCVMKILQGHLKESLFRKTEGKLALCKETVLGEGEVAYIHDRIGWHRVANCTGDGKGAVSLHLYAPPIEKCRTVEEGTGRIRAKAACQYHSKYGKISASKK